MHHAPTSSFAWRRPVQLGARRRQSRIKEETRKKNDNKHVGSPLVSSPPAAATKTRARSNSKKEPPTLLTDFLRGKQSPARLAAERKRRQSEELLRAELRQEMRQSAVRKIQQPGGVKDRVDKWQKAHTSAMMMGDPDDVATEPTDLAFAGQDEESVTESDRIRIKMRQGKRAPNKPKETLDFPNTEAGTSEKENEVAEKVRLSSPPKKKVVSDEHWKKQRKRQTSPRQVTPPRKVSPLSRKPSPISGGLPSDFVKRAGGSPLVSSKVKEWAAKIELSDTSPSPRNSRTSRSRRVKSPSTFKENERKTFDSAGGAKTPQTPKPGQGFDDGIRVTPLPSNKSDKHNVGVESGSPGAILHDDGIRVRPSDETPQAESAQASKIEITAVSDRSSSPMSRSRVTGDTVDVSQRIHNGADEREKKSHFPRRRNGRVGFRLKTLETELSKSTEGSSLRSEEQSALSTARDAASDTVSSLAKKSVADIPGDIPFGHSAFSELDLTAEGQPKSRPKRTKVDRTSSLKAVPNVFKKVVEEGKKIIHEMHEPPRPVNNQPPSIEKWLNNTVDPFIDNRTVADKPITPSIDEESKSANEFKKVDGSHRRGSHGNRSSQSPSIGSANKGKNQAVDDAAAMREGGAAAVFDPPEEPVSPTPIGLKRSRATRSSVSPLKSGRGTRQLFGAFKEAFHGESNTLPLRPKSHQNSEQPKPSNIGTAPDPCTSSASGSTSDAIDSIRKAPKDEPLWTRPLSSRPPPPTRGDHELSTILSEENCSVIESDLTSELTYSTFAPSTVLTKVSEASTEQSRDKPGLKRRLTKHSDLVSVLSLPDDSIVPGVVRSSRSRPSLRKTRNPSVSVTAQELLQEFIDDENLYLRELKTLVDGVVPVLLAYVVNSTNATDIFSPSPSSAIPDKVSRSVVSMGVSLEKLRSAHKRAPTTDARKLANWAHGVVPLYKSYLGAWRLGFDDVVVNLAPASSGKDDDDSLLAALPRNGDGDVIHENGERVAVAHLLKRPLIRIKQLAKLMKCIDSLVASNDTHELVRDFEDLQERSRRRFKEENARIIDEEAFNTDTSRCRDLSTLEAAPATRIETNRQVSAKDVFYLSLAHSNHQKLDCQVELVHRDNPKDSNDQGDILIRETGEGGRPYLLFPPIDISCLSARTGDSNLHMVVMVRSASRDSLWREFLVLKSDHEDQILDWLDMLPLLPVPPLDITWAKSREDEAHSLESPVTPTQRREPVFRPVFAEKASPSPVAKDIFTASPSHTETPSRETRKATPTRYRQRSTVTEDPTQSTTQRNGLESQDLDKTPTKDATLDREGRGRPLKESMRPDPSLFQTRSQPQSPMLTPLREDGAPPPPVHRTFSSTSPTKIAAGIRQTAPILQPVTADTPEGERVKRRTSSPLKHEYLPSDQSSASEAHSTEESDTESSDDEIESLDIPETELGVSIKSVSDATGSRTMLVSQCSLTPSNSASQAGLHRPKAVADQHTSRFMARISRWSDKGLWKDVASEPCSVAVRDGLIEAFAFRTAADMGNSDSPLLALDLTPLVLIRQSTAVDLEIRSSVQSHSKLYQNRGGGNFRFRCSAASDCYNLYMAVHQARLNNQKFIELENEARFKSFGERQGPDNDGDASSSKRRSWFGRKNSYRSSVRAPSQSQDGASTTPSSTPSASSFLKRLTVSGSLSFNIARSSVDRQPRFGSGSHSLYTSRSSSAGDASPRSPSISVENSSQRAINFGAGSVPVRLHLLVTSTKWEDHGNCSLQIRQPPPGWRQALRANHGLEKRITVTTMPKKEADEAKIALDAVLGSGCFSPMGSRGIVCGVWEEVKNGAGVVGMVPETGATGGNIKKWCFQFANAAEAQGVLRLVHQEVMRA